MDPTGARLWVQRVMVRGKRRELGLGGFPTVTLAEAREAALENKRVAFRGGDPLAERRRAKAIPTCREAAIATHAELSPTWTNPKDRDAFLTTLETYLYPTVGDTRLPEVTSGELRKAILAARAKAPGVARKLTFRCAHVFRRATAEGHVSANPATAEAEKLKGASGLLFPSRSGKPLSDVTLSKLVKELGFDADVHGFRTSFRTWAQERTSFPREVAEMALAHVNKDRVEAAYARSDLLEKRRKMMDAWAGPLAQPPGRVVKLARAGGEARA